MMMTGLSGKHIVLGISGGIAAYKAPELVRRLRERGAEVRVVMTAAAKSFVTPLSLQAVSGYPVSDDLLDPAAEAAMGHIELGKWADLVLIAPATADLLARMAAGMANDLLTTVCLATAAPIAVLPAMNQQMYRATVTQDAPEQDLVADGGRDGAGTSRLLTADLAGTTSGMFTLSGLETQSETTLSGSQVVEQRRADGTTERVTQELGIVVTVGPTGNDPEATVEATEPTGP